MKFWNFNSCPEKVRSNFCIVNSSPWVRKVRLHVYARGVKAEVTSILLRNFAATLIEATVDQDAPAGSFDEMAGPGDVTIGPMER